MYGTLILNTNKKTTFSNPITINGRLILESSPLELGDNNLEIGYDGSIIGSASYYVIVNGKGKLRHAVRNGQEVSLPIGGISYNPAKIKLSPGSQDDIFSVSMLDGVYASYTNDIPVLTSPIASNMVNKTWLISEDVKGGSDISLTLTWTLTDALTGFNPAKSYVAHFENGVWDTDGFTSATVSTVPTGLTSLITYSVTRSGITSFSPFSMSSNEPTLLPVELISFTAKATALKTVKLNWATASEINNDFFKVERSADGRNFTSIGQIKGAGTTNSRQEYSFTDNQPMGGNSYYRLRQSDLNGTTVYSKICAVSNSMTQNLVMSLYPNPAQGAAVTLQIKGLPSTSEASVVVTDMMGRNILPRSLATGGTATLPTKSLPAGTYLISIVSKEGAQTQRLVIR